MPPRWIHDARGKDDDVIGRRMGKPRCATIPYVPPSTAVVEGREHNWSVGGRA
jgi:hypothetical protein